MKKIETEIIIHAPKTIVWQILTDFEAYPNWNPFIRSITGQAAVGKKLDVAIQITGSKKTFKMQPNVLNYAPQQELRWKGKLWLNGLFDGEHYFQLDALSEQTTRFVHGEHFSGLFVPLLMKQIGEGTLAGFHAMNAALKSAAEQVASRVVARA
ncbi:MAG: SRPBCC domain-containing protein [Bacteroidota bacterium]